MLVKTQNKAGNMCKTRTDHYFKSLSQNGTLIGKKSLYTLGKELMAILSLSMINTNHIKQMPQIL